MQQRHLFGRLGELGHVIFIELLLPTVSWTMQDSAAYTTTSFCCIRHQELALVNSSHYWWRRDIWRRWGQLPHLPDFRSVICLNLERTTGLHKLFILRFLGLLIHKCLIYLTFSLGAKSDPLLVTLNPVRLHVLALLDFIQALITARSRSWFHLGVAEDSTSELKGRIFLRSDLAGLDLCLLS